MELKNLPTSVCIQFNSIQVELFTRLLFRPWFPMANSTRIARCFGDAAAEPTDMVISAYQVIKQSTRTWSVLLLHCRDIRYTHTACIL